VIKISPVCAANVPKNESKITMKGFVVCLPGLKLWLLDPGLEGDLFSLGKLIPTDRLSLLLFSEQNKKRESQNHLR
jgi:hypothetical protein